MPHDIFAQISSKISTMEIIIRKSDEDVFFLTENLTREAFWNLFKSGCDEHLVLHQLRESKSYVEALDIVAIHENDITGHIITTKARVIDGNEREHEVLCAGPLSVSPSLQNQGIGTMLMNHSISEARKLGFKAMFLYGDPAYYHRFGFRNSGEYSITTKDGQNFEPFMALELQENAMKDIKGKFYEDEAFITREEVLKEFERKFPYKEKGKPKIDLSL
jgi:predicted N-acetyltransferase YhbS